MQLHEACKLHLETSTAGPNKVRTYGYWVEELLGRFPLHAPLEALTHAELRAWADWCRDTARNSPATIYAKMSLAKGIYGAAVADGYAGPVPNVPRPRVPRVLKWWLNPDLERKALQWCDQHGEVDLRDFLAWTCETGLRVEETLRCTPQHFINLDGPEAELLVPGTKNSTSQATLPISEEARLIAARRIAQYGTLFGSPGYWALARRWRWCRKSIGVTSPTATLKAMRRTFARKRAAKGCPLPVLQDMMRHRDPNTTLEYLRLTGGGFTVPEMRKYL